MPFDAATDVRKQTVAEQIGLVPVPDDVLEAHKAAYAKAYFASPRAYRGARWIEYTEENLSAYGGVFKWAAHPHVSSGNEPSMAAPAEVKAVVAEAERRLSERGIASERVLGTFYTDPYIKLRYSKGRRAVDVCLAIWDQGKVLHIAKFID